MKIRLGLIGKCRDGKDFRGVVCSPDYVKVKVALGQMDDGEVLSVLLHEGGAKNVSDSTASDGHEMLSVGPEGEPWKVVIRKRVNTKSPS